MKYVLTGSIGHITKPIAQALVAANNSVSIITSKETNKQAIETLGATALVGSVEDVNFLENSFAGADAVYLMIPPKFTVTDWLGYQQAVADNYVQALQTNGIKQVVVLSSVGAHMGKGAGPVDGLAYLESKLSEYPEVNAVYLRPSYFYYNLFAQATLLKHAGIMGSTQPATHKLVLTHTTDIADAAIAALQNVSFEGKKVQYIASDEATWQEITAALSIAVGKENIPFVEFSDEQSYAGMLQAGLSEVLANGYKEMGIALRSGEMEADYWANRPATLGKVKLADFAKEFAAAYQA